MYYINHVSGNTKTGPMPVSMTGRATCPPSCAFYGNGCYAETGHINIHWKKQTTLSLLEFCKEIRHIPARQLWRMNQAGDLPGHGETIDIPALQQITRANKNKRGFTYTHKYTTAENLDAIQAANNSGFTVNLSANNAGHADKLADTGLPVVVVVPLDAPKVSHTPKGRKIVSCPNHFNKRITCHRCGLCQIKDRKYIIGFHPVGVRMKIVDSIARS